MIGIQQTSQFVFRKKQSWILLALVCLQVSGQTPDSFDPKADNWVYATIVQPDGRIIVGGEFTNIVGQSRNYLARLDLDGSLDTSFNPCASNTVNCLALQPDGKILVGGLFDGIGGQIRGRIARLNPDGSLDASFNPGANNTVTCLALQPDGKIIVGGNFNFLGGQPWNPLGRLHPTGALDTSFNPTPSNGVSSVAIQPDGKILIAGSFTGIGGQLRSRIARLNADGSLDDFNPGVSSTPLSLVVQPDRGILVGGSFTTLAGQPRNRLGRLNEDGSLDFAFDPGANNSVNSLALQADGKILVGGSFTNLAGQSCNRVGRLNYDGSFDFSFSSSADAFVHSLTVQPDGRILVGGRFLMLSGQPRNYLGRLNNTGSADESLNYDGASIIWSRSGTSPEVWRASFDASTNGTTWIELGAAMRNSSGWQLSPLPLPGNATFRARGFLSGSRNNGSSWHVEKVIGPPAFTQQPGSRTNLPATTATFEAAAVGSTPLSYQWRKGAQNLSNGNNVLGARTPVLTLSNVFGADAGTYSIVVSNASGSVTSVVATLTVMDPVILSQPLGVWTNAQQTAWFSVTAAGSDLKYQWRKESLKLAGATSATLTLTNVQFNQRGNYDVVVSNQFGSVTSVVAELSVNLALPDFASSAESVRAVALQPDGKILIGGTFDAVAGQSRRGIARLNSDGSLDNSFTVAASFWVGCFAMSSDREILVGGGFTQLGGLPRNYLGRLKMDGSVDPDFTLSATEWMFDLIAMPDGRTLLGGSFYNLGGQGRYALARLETNGIPDPDFVPIVRGRENSIGYLTTLAVQPDGNIVAGGSFIGLNDYYGITNIGRLYPDGRPDTNFNCSANLDVLAVAMQPDGKILVAGWFSNLNGQPRSYLGRLNSNGTLDESFNPTISGVGPSSSIPNNNTPSVSDLALQTDGKIIIGGRFTNVLNQARSCLARLNPDGTVDPTFDPRIEGVDAAVYSLALQRDGRVVVGGLFSQVAGQPADGLARIHNPDPATESLSVAGSTITWLRGGSSPEVWATTFDASGDGTNWTRLGTGTRIPGGWQLAGVSVPQGATLRARCWAIGSSGDSSWYFETSLVPSAVLTLSATGPDAGWVSNRFNLKLNSSPGQAIVIEASTNLIYWQPIHTNLMADTGVYLFRDLASGGFPRRFYRARLHVGPLPAPSIRTSSGAIQGGRFQFSVDGVSGMRTIIEASTNLVNWTPLLTNQMGPEAFVFTDAAPTNHAARFYRTRLQ